MSSFWSVLKLSHKILPSAHDLSIMSFVMIHFQTVFNVYEFVLHITLVHFKFFIHSSK